MSKKEPSSASKATEDEEDDYMNMSFEEPAKKSLETSLQRRERLKREAELRSRPKSKSELAELERQKRDEGLNKSLLADNKSKGLKMMKAMGYKAGENLGAGSKDENERDELEKRLTEPLRPQVKETRAGIGHDTHVKRKITEAVGEEDPEAKRRREDPADYRARMNEEAKARRQEGQFRAAQKVCERLDGKERTNVSQIRQTPILWRGLLWHRARKALDERLRHDIMTTGVSASSLREGYTADPDLDKDDKIALGVEESLDEEWDDEELVEFEARDISERLDEIVNYLREKWNYCFWCKYQYPDEAMEGCPGKTEEDHD